MGNPGEDIFNQTEDLQPIVYKNNKNFSTDINCICDITSVVFTKII